MTKEKEHDNHEICFNPCFNGFVVMTASTPFSKSIAIKFQSLF